MNRNCCCFRKKEREPIPRDQGEPMAVSRSHPGPAGAQAGAEEPVGGERTLVRALPSCRAPCDLVPRAGGNQKQQISPLQGAGAQNKQPSHWHNGKRHLLGTQAGAAGVRVTTVTGTVRNLQSALDP